MINRQGIGAISQSWTNAAQGVQRRLIAFVIMFQVVAAYFPGLKFD